MGKIGVNKQVVSTNIDKITSSGQDLFTVVDGLRHPGSNINTITPKEIRKRYTQISELLMSYGGLVINDARRISDVVEHMKEYDEQAGRR